MEKLSRKTYFNFDQYLLEKAESNRLRGIFEINHVNTLPGGDTIICWKFSFDHLVKGYCSTYFDFEERDGVSYAILKEKLRNTVLI